MCLPTASSCCFCCCFQLTASLAKVSFRACSSSDPPGIARTASNSHDRSHCHAAGARVVAKAYPEERVGVFAQRDGRIEVVEYSELDPHEAAATDPSKHKSV